MGVSFNLPERCLQYHPPPFPLSPQPQITMDAIRKKMQSLKAETDGLYNTIAGFEEATREAVARADQADCDIRDYGKKVQQLEIGFDETNDKLTIEELDKNLRATVKMASD